MNERNKSRDHRSYRDPRSSNRGASPEDLADGTEVILTIGTDIAVDEGPMSPDEIARVLAAMGQIRLVPYRRLTPNNPLRYANRDFFTFERCAD